MSSCQNKPRVSSDDFLYRRTYYSPVHKYCNPDGTPTSRVFKLREKDKGCLSVDIASKTTPIKSAVDSTKFVVFSIKVASVESLNLTAHEEPMTLDEHEIDNPAHGAIWGMDIDDDILPAQLARLCSPFISF